MIFFFFFYSVYGLFSNFLSNFLRFKNSFKFSLLHFRHGGIKIASIHSNPSIYGENRAKRSYLALFPSNHAGFVSFSSAASSTASSFFIASKIARFSALSLSGVVIRPQLASLCRLAE